MREGVRDQRVLGPEVVEDQRRADAELLGDVGDADRRQPDAVEQVGGRGQDLLAPHLDVAAGPARHCRSPMARSIEPTGTGGTPMTDTHIDPMDTVRAGTRADG